MTKEQIIFINNLIDALENEDIHEGKIIKMSMELRDILVEKLKDIIK